MASGFPLLSLLIWLPIVGGVLTLALGKSGNRDIVRKTALGVSVFVFILSLPLYSGFDTETFAMQFGESVSWIPTFNVFYSLGIDGISMPLIILTTFTTVLVVLAGWEVIEDRQEQYMAAFLIMEGLMNGVFCALDAVLFYVFWEGMLIPMFLIIGIWGGPRRIYAALKFFLYTFLGSVLLLVAIIYLYNQTSSFAILDFHMAKIGMTAQTLIFFRLPGRVRSQGPDVAGPYLVTGCPCRGPDRWFSHPGRDHVEDGYLWLRAVHPAYRA